MIGYMTWLKIQGVMIKYRHVEGHHPGDRTGVENTAIVLAEDATPALLAGGLLSNKDYLKEREDSLKFYVQKGSFVLLGYGGSP